MKKQVKKVIQKMGKFYRLKIKFPFYYRMQAMKPVDPHKAVFIENRFLHITNSFSLLHKTLGEKYHLTIKDCFLNEVESTPKQYKKNCMSMIKEVARAKYVFVNDSSNIVGCIPFRKETRIIQTWHGCGAFKKWGYSNVREKFGAGLKEMKKYPFYADYSLVTVSSPEVIWAYKEAFNLPQENTAVKATGVSRTDVFFNKDYIENAYKHLYEIAPQTKGKKVILYAPTFRGNVAGAKGPANLNQKVFCEMFSDEYVLLCKHHPSVLRRPPVEDGCGESVLDVTDHMSMEELMCVSDICITDYSSIIFEYSLFERPIIIYAYDFDRYVDWRGFYYNFEEFVPGPIAKNNRELFDCIKDINNYDIQKVRDFKYKFMRSCDGNATERIIAEIFAMK